MVEESNIIRIELGELTQSCFVIMPFTGTFTAVYERVMRPAVEEAGLICVRADELFSRPQITHDIWKQIRSCRLVLAELSGRNSNVLYELGLAHAIGKPAIIITSKEEDVPFDLKALRYLYYNTDDPFWGETLKRSLTEMCKKVAEQIDFGSVFEGISSTGELIFPEVPAAPIQPVQMFDITGLWQGIASNVDRDEAWNLDLLQNAGNLTGTLVVTYRGELGLTVVQESMLGEIKGENIVLRGVSYSYFLRGRESDYSLDDFEGIVKSHGTEVEGIITSGDNYIPLILKRLS